MLQFAALSFDVAFQEIFSTLCTGGTLVLLSEWLRRDGRGLLEFLSERRVERLFVPPLMLQSLGGPLVLAVIQAVITSRTLYLGGITGPVKFMNEAQLHALDKGYTYGLLWIAGAAVIVGCAALFIGYTPDQVAHAQEVKEAIDAGEL